MYCSKSLFKIGHYENGTISRKFTDEENDVFQETNVFILLNIHKYYLKSFKRTLD